MMTPADRTRRMLKRFVEREGLTLAQVVFSDQRDEKVVEVRHKAMHFLWKKRGWTHSDIGRLFNRDHTTVRYACLKIEARGLTSHVGGR